LIFVMIRCFRELFQIVLFEIQVDGIAESRSDRSIGPVGDAQYIQIRVILSFVFVELQRIRRNLHRQIHARGIRRGVEIGHLERPLD
jgi:hypothetical protein